MRDVRVGTVDSLGLDGEAVLSSGGSGPTKSTIAKGRVSRVSTSLWEGGARTNGRDVSHACWKRMCDGLVAQCDRLWNLEINELRPLALVWL